MRYTLRNDAETALNNLINEIEDLERQNKILELRVEELERELETKREPPAPF